MTSKNNDGASLGDYTPDRQVNIPGFKPPTEPHIVKVPVQWDQPQVSHAGTSWISNLQKAMIKMLESLSPKWMPMGEDMCQDCEYEPGSEECLESGHVVEIHPLSHAGIDYVVMTQAAWDKFMTESGGLQGAMSKLHSLPVEVLPTKEDAARRCIQLIMEGKHPIGVST